MRKPPHYPVGWSSRSGRFATLTPTIILCRKANVLLNCFPARKA
uniref:Uncharacterized protein n=1 Tax=Rhizophora mucronata TaxID=61149 RepID=A0A2P2N5F8_RHIMU